MREAEEDAERGDDDDDRDDGAEAIEALGGDPEAPAPKRGAKKSAKQVQVKPKKRAKRGAQASAEAE
jgi:hypothetical protein